MIAFDLQCSNGHVFEGWFKDSHTFDSQIKHGYITCPVCEDTSVAKIPTTFGILKGPANRTSQRVDINCNPERSETVSVSGVDKKGALNAFFQGITHFIEKNFEDVGTEFAKEALKIHYGVNEPRNIRGISTEQEEKVLKKEGIYFLKMPILKPSPESDTN